MKKLLKRIWYRIVYKKLDETNFCRGCVNDIKEVSYCYKFFENYGCSCGIKIFVKRFKL